MRSKVAEQLRREQVGQIQRLTPAQRVALALELGVPLHGRGAPALWHNILSASSA